MTNSNIARKAQEETRKPTKKSRLRPLRLADHEGPQGAVTWTSENIEKWRRDFAAAFRGRSAPLAIALEVLPHIPKRGYCARQNPYLMAQTGLHRSDFYEGFAAIVESGFFIVATCGTERRIWLGNPNESGKPGQRAHPGNPDGRVRETRTQESGKPGFASPGNPDSTLYRESSRDSTEKEREPEQPSESKERASNVVVLAVGTAGGVASVTASSAQASNANASEFDLSTLQGRILARKPTPEDVAAMTPEQFRAEGLRRRAEDERRERERYEAQLKREREEDLSRHEMWKLANADWLADEFNWKSLPPESGFWPKWKREKEAMKAKGYKVEKIGGEWKVLRRRRAASLPSELTDAPAISR